MSSPFLSSLSDVERKNFIAELWRIQNGRCFISDEPIDLHVHKDLDIDHIVPLSVGGKDDKSNLALTFSSANRSKQASDLKLARTICAYERIRRKAEEEGRGPNLNDVLLECGGASHPLVFHREGVHISYSYSAIGRNEIVRTPIYADKISGIEYFFALVPIEYIYHDSKVNPRTIGKNVSKLITEFYKKNPQLHISLGYIDTAEDNSSRVFLFDGQHKTAAQLFLGTREIPVRIFINPDINQLTQTNFNAGTTLRQVAFDKSIQRHLGNTMYKDRVLRYQRENGLDEDNLDFSEGDLVDYFRGESMRRYIIDAIRDSIIHDSENKLSKYVDFGGKAKEKPLSYATIDKTFFSFFINTNMLATHISHGLEEGKNPRTLTIQQLIQLMNIIAEEVLIDKFSFEYGTDRIESKIQKGENLPLEHIRACRMCKEEVLYCWLRCVEQVVFYYFSNTGSVIGVNGVAQLFEYEFPPVLWDNIRNFMRNLCRLPLWVDTNLSSTVFGGKQVYDYWRSIFATGKTPQLTPVLAVPLHIIEMIRP